MKRPSLSDHPSASDNQPVTDARRRGNVLPLSLPPRGLSREQGAAYVGVSPSFFDQLVRDGRMPQPKRINSRTVWDRNLLDLAFDALSGEQDHSAEDWTVAV